MRQEYTFITINRSNQLLVKQCNQICLYPAAQFRDMVRAAARLSVYFVHRYCGDLTRQYSYCEDPMTDVGTEELINKMLDSKKLGSDASEDLKDFLQDIKEGNFHRDDDAYVLALAQRLGFTDGKAVVKGKGSNASATKKIDNVDWHERAVIAEARL